MRVWVPGSATLLLVPGMAHLDPQRAVFEAMLDGWALQQRSRNLKGKTIAPRLALIQRLAVFSNQYPWQRPSAEVEACL